MRRFRSNFIVGYPGETEEDQDRLLDFVEEARLDWCGFFPYSPEEGTYAADLDGEVAGGLVRRATGRAAPSCRIASRPRSGSS